MAGFRSISSVTARPHELQSRAQSSTAPVATRPATIDPAALDFLLRNGRSGRVSPLFAAMVGGGLPTVRRALPDAMHLAATETPAADGPPSTPTGLHHFSSEINDPDWRRVPGYRDVTSAEWNDGRWQQRHTVTKLGDLKTVLGDHLTDELMADIAADQTRFATMAIRLPPNMIAMLDLNNLRNDPVRRYMLAMASDRHGEWPTHPMATRDSLHEAEMWTAPGLTHRYPTKVLFETTDRCPQYCSHCTRLNVVGPDVPQVIKQKFGKPTLERYADVFKYLAAHPTVTDVVVSGGDVASLPPDTLEAIVIRLIELGTIRDIRLASKGLMGMPQHFLRDDVLAVMGKIAALARAANVRLALHTHVNHPNQVTATLRQAVSRIRDLGFDAVRNQGVLLRGVNSDSEVLIALCNKLFEAGIVPYYFYNCDMIPNAEHWRLAIWEAQLLERGFRGRLSGYKIPQIVCDAPYAGKMLVHHHDTYDRDRGVTEWQKMWLRPDEVNDPARRAIASRYFDPVYTLSATGQAWWRERVAALRAAGVDNPSYDDFFGTSSNA